MNTRVIHFISGVSHSPPTKSHAGFRAYGLKRRRGQHLYATEMNTLMTEIASLHFCPLLPSPIWLRVAATERQTAEPSCRRPTWSISARCQNGWDWKHDVSSIRRPGRKIVGVHHRASTGPTACWRYPSGRCRWLPEPPVHICETRTGSETVLLGDHEATLRTPESVTRCTLVPSASMV